LQLTIVAAKKGKEIISPLQYSGSMDGILFEHWFEHCLLPNLSLSTTIVMDNASFHRKSKLFSIAEKYGHKIIFLPPYSPELNPIESFWAWLKSKLKKILHNYDVFDEALCYCFNVL
jgi:putative transposase